MQKTVINVFIRGKLLTLQKIQIMFTLVNIIENKIVAQPKSVTELLDKVNLIRIENKDFDFSVLGISDATEYIEDYSSDLLLLTNREVEEFLSTYCTEVNQSEPSHYVEFMMDNHKCIEWEGKQFYIPEDFNFEDEEHEISYALTTAFHV